MKPKLFLLTLFSIIIYTADVSGQKPSHFIEVRVAADKPGWTYRMGENIGFSIEITKNNNLVEGLQVNYELSEDMMPAFDTGTFTSGGERHTIEAGNWDKPGFIRCRATVEYDGRQYGGSATAAVEPALIEPVAVEPDDFREFWAHALASNRALDMDARLTLLPERCTGSVDVYQLSLQNCYPGARVYGILCVPKAEGKYPALMTVPGAGIRPYNGDIYNASRGYITLEIGIHGVPVTMPHSFYDDLQNGPLRDYARIKPDDRNEYYYKRVYLGCVRALDYISSMPQFDGENLAVRGGSQGGALAIVTASLDPRVSALSAFYPALCDLTGYLHGRAGGWPHFFSDGVETPERVATAGYYDVVNFARYITVPGFYSLGYNDTTCPPTTMFSALNSVTAPKEIFLIEELGHYSMPEQWVKESEWLDSQLKTKE